MSITITFTQCRLDIVIKGETTDIDKIDNVMYLCQWVKLSSVIKNSNDV